MIRSHYRKSMRKVLLRWWSASPFGLVMKWNYKMRFLQAPIDNIRLRGAVSILSTSSVIYLSRLLPHHKFWTYSQEGLETVPRTLDTVRDVRLERYLGEGSEPQSVQYLEPVYQTGQYDRFDQWDWHAYRDQWCRNIDRSSLGDVYSYRNALIHQISRHDQVDPDYILKLCDTVDLLLDPLLISLVLLVTCAHGVRIGNWTTVRCSRGIYLSIFAGFMMWTLLLPEWLSTYTVLATIGLTISLLVQVNSILDKRNRLESMTSNFHNVDMRSSHHLIAGNSWAILITSVCYHSLFYLLVGSSGINGWIKFLLYLLTHFYMWHGITTFKSMVILEDIEANGFLASGFDMSDDTVRERYSDKTNLIVKDTQPEWFQVGKWKVRIIHLLVAHNLIKVIENDKFLTINHEHPWFQPPHFNHYLNVQHYKQLITSHYIRDHVTNNIFFLGFILQNLMFLEDNLSTFQRCSKGKIIKTNVILPPLHSTQSFLYLYLPSTLGLSLFTKDKDDLNTSELQIKNYLWRSLLTILSIGRDRAYNRRPNLGALWSAPFGLGRNTVVRTAFQITYVLATILMVIVLLVLTNIGRSRKQLNRLIENISFQIPQSFWVILILVCTGAVGWRYLRPVWN